jgi:hypothetical protein
MLSVLALVDPSRALEKVPRVDFVVVIRGRPRRAIRRGLFLRPIGSAARAL